MPPSTTPARTRIVSRSAKSGVTSGFCTGEHHRDDRREQARDQHGGTDHASRPHAEQLGRTEVHCAQHACAARRGCDRAAGRGPAGTRLPAPSRRSRSCGCRRRRSSPAGSTSRVTPQIFPSGPNHEQRDALQEERDCERRDEHHGRRLPAQRPEDDPVHRAARARERPRSRGRCRPRRASRVRRRRRAAYAPAITSCP